jgi:hypothetical protein
MGALGLASLPVWFKWATIVVLGALAVLNVYILATVIVPAYWSVM